MFYACRMVVFEPLRSGWWTLVLLAFWTAGMPAQTTPTYSGYLDEVDCGYVTGWAWNPAQPSVTLFVDLYENSRLLETLVADAFRQDLLQNGVGKGYHGFSYPIPPALQDGQRHIITAKFAGTNIELQRSGHDVTCPAYAGLEAARFLEQATFGPTEALLEQVRRVGPEAFLEEQFSLPVSGYPPMPYYPPNPTDNCRYLSSDPNGPISLCYRDNYSLFPLQLRFFQNALTAPDQVRQRVAFALHQIWVVSGVKINQAYAMAEFQQLIYKNALGNFRQLLQDITLNPAMGRYLDMVNNDKPDTQRGISANENYAREVLQLFSVGLFLLNPNGTWRLDAQGNPVPTYTQGTIENLARVFTGWTYPTMAGAKPTIHNPVNYLGAMELFPGNHDTGAKNMLDGLVLPAGQTGEKDLADALDSIFRHANVGPFICKQLIQHLVTSNPSPSYVARIAGVFDDNGKKVRGDLKAVVKAILLDPEARGESRVESSFGHLREPILFMTHLLRALNGISDGVYLKDQAAGMGQNLFYSPTVFNYYPADFLLPGGALLGPEFGIQEAPGYFARVNFINSLIFSNGIAPNPTVANATGTRINLSPLIPLVGDPMKLIERLNQLLLHGAMPWSMQNVLFTAISAVPLSDPLTRVRTAVYLTATSSQYQVER